MSGANKRIVQRYFEEVLQGRNFDLVSELVSTNYTNHSLVQDDIGFVGLRQRLGKLFEAFPDAQFDLADLIAEDDRVVARWTLQGTHSGVFNGGIFNSLEPTGRPFTMSAITIFRLEDGQVVECWNERDRLGRLLQLGVLPVPERSRPAGERDQQVHAA